MLKFKQRKMKLHIAERLILASILPEKGNFETMDTIEKLKSALYLSEEEAEKYEFKQDGDRVTWNKEGSEPVDLEFSTKGVAFLLKTLEDLDKNEELTIQSYSVYKKFKEEEK